MGLISVVRLFFPKLAPADRYERWIGHTIDELPGQMQAMTARVCSIDHVLSARSPIRVMVPFLSRHTATSSTS